MILNHTLHEGILLKRYKRFLADVELANGRVIVAHCPNPGSLMGCCEAGSRVLMRHTDDPKRKLKYTWMIVYVGNTPVNVDTQLPNKAMYDALLAGDVPELAGYERIEKESTFGDSRFDIFLSRGKNKDCYVEIKSTTLAENGVAMFPDARTVRGRKHLNGLMAAVDRGFRAVQFFFISRNDIDSFRPADHIDPDYGETLREAARHGVEILAYSVDFKPDKSSLKVSLASPVSVDLS